MRVLGRYLAAADPTVRKIRLDIPEEKRLGNDPEMVAAQRKRLGQVMAEGCGIVRCAEGLQRARRTLAEIRESLLPPARNG